VKQRCGDDSVWLRWQRGEKRERALGEEVEVTESDQGSRRGRGRWRRWPSRCRPVAGARTRPRRRRHGEGNRGAGLGLAAQCQVSLRPFGYFCFSFYLINRKREVIYLGNQMVLKKYRARPNIPRAIFHALPQQVGGKKNCLGILEIEKGIFYCCWITI
jgi:hypothetical protein